MQSEFLNFIKQNRLFSSSQRYLLAMSGGVDSMVLGALLLDAGVEIEVAHCNFKLRGKSSDADEELVKNWADEHGVPCHTRDFPLQSAGEKSIQEEARIVRYQWFFELLESHQLSAIVTAHHASDNFETLMINLLRGSGAFGWSGVPLNENNIIRPLLFASKEQIEQFAKRYKISFREDESNASDNYLRNKIRHGLAKEFKALDADYERRISQNQMQLRQSLKMTQALVELQNTEAIQEKSDTLEIVPAKLQPAAFAVDVLYFVLREKGFNYAQCVQALEANHSGKTWSSATHEMLFDRDRLLVRLRNSEAGEAIQSAQIFSDTEHIQEPVNLVFKRESGSGFVPSTVNTTAALDVDALQFPLVLRKWKAGDKFVPLGMNQSKLVSDFLTDQKVDHFQKEAVCVIESAGEIVWVVGYRIANPFRITPQTRQVFLIDLPQ